MKYFLYRMSSSDPVPGGGSFRSWLHFYKWGRPETVTFRKRTPHFVGAQKGDVMFFVLDDALIGDAIISDVRDDLIIECSRAVQEIDVPEGGIWEYLRTWGFWDRLRDRLDLLGVKEEVPLKKAVRWLCYFRGGVPFETHPGYFAWGAIHGRTAVYDPDVPPPFFSVKEK